MVDEEKLKEKIKELYLERLKDPNLVDKISECVKDCLNAAREGTLPEGHTLAQCIRNCLYKKLTFDDIIKTTKEGWGYISSEGP